MARRPFVTLGLSGALMLALLAGGACGGEGHEGRGDTLLDPPVTMPDPPSCVRRTSSALSVVDRSIIGSPAAYTADPTLRARDEELKHSQRKRREAAWQVVERVLRPVELDASLLPNATAPVLPAFQTWHAADDLSRIFNRVYGKLSAEQRLARAPLGRTALMQGFAWNDSAIADFPEWTAERLLEYQEAVESAAQVSGLGSLTRVAYGPEASAHLLDSYGDVLRCRDEPPNDTTPAPIPSEETLYEEPLALDACADFALPAIDLRGDESLRVYFGHRQGKGKVQVRTLAKSAAALHCVPQADVPCIVTGPASVHVSAQTDESALTGDLRVVRVRKSALSAPCMRGTFPVDAVVVKADWRRAQFGQELPVYDTSAEGLKTRLASTGDLSWTEPDAQANPGPEDIYTLELPNGNLFRLAALHIMTKELDHWLWVTLWWSPTPDTDFGADRPDTLRGAFRNYKMCAVSAVAEGDANPTGGYDGEQESLARSLAATYAGQGGPSWCSNPYLERGAGNANTNCMGCHQHAGTKLTPETILSDHAAFPLHGRTEQRRDFPSDYVFAATAGDNLGAMFQAMETHHGDP
jgi:hypothetical protein